MPRILRCLPVVLFALAAGAVSAEDIDIKLGTEVRVTTSGPPVTGTLAGLTQKSIVLLRNDERVEFPLGDVEKLEVMQPARKGHYPETMLLGAVGGGVVGGLAGGLIVADGVSSTAPPPSDSDIKTGAAVGAAVGAVGGAVGGYLLSRLHFHRDPHWEDVEFRPTIRVGALPVRGRGFGLAISVAF
jgi:hypothetical protein